MDNKEQYLEVFVLTNESDTLPICLNFLLNQNINFKYQIVKNMNIVDAMHYCLNQATKKYFVKLDDDMILHPNALEYINYCLYKHEYGIMHRQKKEIGLYTCNLWEFWANRIVKCIKAYNVDIAKQVGFEKDERGKIDKNYIKSLKNRKIYNIYDKSIIALHTLRDYEIQKKYRTIWMHNANIDNLLEFQKKDFDQSTLHNIHIKTEEYINKMTQLRKLNKNYGFKKFIK
jgi:hypothetical protein